MRNLNITYIGGKFLRINSSYIGMESARRKTSVTTVSTDTAAQGSVQFKQGIIENLLTGWSGRSGQYGMDGDTMNGLRYARSDNYNIKEISDTGNAEKIQRIRAECIMYLFQLLFANRKHGGMTEDGVIYGAENSADFVSDAYAVSNTAVAGSVKYFHGESEVTAFSTKGKVVTADGKEIDFGLDLKMSRSFAQYYEKNYQMPQQDLCDPLVINLKSGMAKLSDQKFLFDLDQDGVLDSISQLESTSGYLALDKNGDGRINDGSELFGTSTGNGFYELAKYDDDGDGWIDEDDEIFDKLLIWTKDENGKDVLYHLKEAGVGAICLSNVSTEFSLKNVRNGQDNGVIRNTGIFLYEDGGVGTVQHIDVAK